VEVIALENHLSGSVFMILHTKKGKGIILDPTHFNIAINYPGFPRKPGGETMKRFTPILTER